MSGDSDDPAWLENETGRKHRLTSSFTIGRAPANSLPLRDAEQRVSSYHARIERNARGRYFVEDRHSTNGTFVNERKITRQELSDGDRIRFGSKTPFVFRQPEPAESEASTLSQLDVTMRGYEEKPCWFVIGDIKGSSKLASTMDGISLSRLVTDWASRCRALAERHHGVMANRTGDGWLLLWNGGGEMAGSLAAALCEIRTLQNDAAPSFRVVIHQGRATIAGGVRAGEDNVLSSDLHQAFRMEKIAAQLGEDMVASAAAAGLLRSVIPCELLPGAFELPGFAGKHHLYRVN